MKHLNKICIPNGIVSLEMYQFSLLGGNVPSHVSLFRTYLTQITLFCYTLLYSTSIEVIHVQFPLTFRESMMGIGADIVANGRSDKIL